MDAKGQEIWFGSQAPYRAIQGRVGPVDWEGLFKPDAPWSKVAAHVSVFTINTQHLRNATDEELAVVVGELNRRKIALGVEMLAQADSPECGRGVEGYYNPLEVRLISEKIKRVGGNLRYITMDEPLEFGHYYSGPNACHSSIEDVASRVAINISEYQKIFPEVIVGDIEPIPSLTSRPNWQSDYREWKAAFERAVGKPLAFLQLDLNWNSLEWPNSLRDTAAMARSLGMKVGIIYNATPSEKGDFEWFNRAKKNFTQAETEVLIPDQAFFSTWDDFPTHVLPEDGPTTHTRLVFEYLLPRTKIALGHSAGSLQGQLLDEKAHPVVNGRVSIRMLGLSNHQDLPLHIMTGIVPTTARYAIAGLRVNTECDCSGDNDIRVGKFSYAEKAGRSDFNGDFTSQARSEVYRNVVRIETQIGSPTIHIVAPRGKSLLFNSAKFAVTPNEKFEFGIAFAPALNTHFSGHATIIFLDENDQGALRINTKYEDDYVPLDTAVTDPLGFFSYDQPKDAAGKPVELRFIFDGSATLRATFASGH